MYHYLSITSANGLAGNRKMKWNKVLIVSFCGAVLLSGCSMFNRDNGSLELPPNATSIESSYDKDQGETLFNYQGRTYSYFGKLNDKMSDDSIRECVGYMDDDKNTRIYSLNEDPLDNYLMIKHVGGIMDQPEFLRATDTKNKDIYTPSYIRSGSFESWGSSGIHYEMSAVNIDVVCNAENVMSVCYDLAINGESERTGGVENADKSAFKKGELLYFEFTEQMIGNQVATGDTFELTLTFSVIDTDGKVHEIDGEYTREMMLGASLSDLEIREDGNGGFILFEDI